MIQLVDRSAGGNHREQHGSDSPRDSSESLPHIHAFSSRVNFRSKQREASDDQTSVIETVAIHVTAPEGGNGRWCVSVL